MNRYWLIVFITALLGFASCRRFDPPQCDLKATAFRPDTLFIFNAVVTDDGGMPYLADKGYCMSFSSEPSFSDPLTGITSISRSNEELAFSWEMEFPMRDTIYYIRAYAKNNAGIGYSNVIRVSTKSEDYE